MAGVYFDCRFVWEGGLTVEKQNDIQNKLIYLDIVKHNERLTEYDYEMRIDKELMTGEDFLRYYGRADDGHKNED